LTGNWKNNSQGNSFECPFGQGKVKAILIRKIEKIHKTAIKKQVAIAESLLFFH